MKEARFLSDKEIKEFLLNRNAHYDGWHYDNGGSYDGVISKVEIDDYRISVSIEKDNKILYTFKIQIANFYQYVLQDKYYKTARFMNTGNNWHIDITSEEVEDYANVVSFANNEFEKQIQERIEEQKRKEAEEIRLMNERYDALPKKGNKVIVNITRGKNKCKDSEGIVFWVGVCKFTGEDSYGVELADKKVFVKERNITKK